MNIKSCDVKEVPRDIYKQMYVLNYGENGAMRKVLVNCRTYSYHEGRVYWIQDGDTLISWALVFEEEYRRKKLNVAHFYTRASHRRMGYGGLLMEKIKVEYGSINVQPHNMVSVNFFSKFSTKRVSNVLAYNKI